MVSDYSTQIIAEIGVNHDGNIEKAKRLVEAAKEAGADIAKFQTYSASKLASARTPKVQYQERDTKSSSHFEMLRRLELSEEAHVQLFEYCNELEIEFMSTPYGLEELRFLVDLGVKRIKLASADIVDIPLQELAGASDVPVILSTGMASLEEIRRVIPLHNQASLCLLVCTSAYPTMPKDMRLGRINRLKEEFRTSVGLSDHSQGYVAAISAVAKGAEVVEKHITLSREDQGPDHLASLEPTEFKRYVSAVREAEEALLGDDFGAGEEERGMSSISRKSAHYSIDTPIGEILTRSHFSLMRPNDGMSWDEVEAVIGKRITRARQKGDPVSVTDFQMV